LRALKAARGRQSAADVVVHRWDLPFLSERLREERYSVDQESLRRYFPPGPTLAWLLDVSAALSRLRFDEARVPVWHDDVRYFDVHDAETAAFIGGIFVDLYPPQGKIPDPAAVPRGGGSRAA